jgi:hypothetical protein
VQVLKLQTEPVRVLQRCCHQRLMARELELQRSFQIHQVRERVHQSHQGSGLEHQTSHQKERALEHRNLQNLMVPVLGFQNRQKREQELQREPVLETQTLVLCLPDQSHLAAIQREY